MIAWSSKQRVLQALLLALAQGCVDDVVVGYQLPGSLEDALVPLPMPDDAQLPQLDATARDAGAADATPADATRPDAAPADAMLPDAAPDASPCLNATCTPTSGPCPGGCGVMVTIVGLDSCSNGEPPQCWYNRDGSCSQQCPQAVSCRVGHAEDCAADEYCHFAREDCGAAGGGLCAPKPVETCPTFRNPACGCDGNTYTNACFAKKAGFAVVGPVTSECGK